MALLHFPNQEILLLALQAEWIPIETQKEPVDFIKNQQGEYSIAISKKAITENLKKLQSQQISVKDKKISINAEQACCWAALLAPERSEEPRPPIEEALFITQNAEDFIQLAKTILTLGYGSAVCAFFENYYLLRVTSPPYYAVINHLYTDNIQVFIPVSRSSNIWLAAAYDHALKNRIQVTHQQILVISKDNQWQYFSNQDWQILDNNVEVLLPSDKKSYLATQSIQFDIALRLIPTRMPQTVSFWVVRKNAKNQMQNVLNQLQETWLNAWLFAANDDIENPIVILKARTGEAHIQPLPIEAETYIAHSQIPNLFLPEGYVLSPLLQRNTLEKLLIPNDNTLVWLVLKDNDFYIETIPETALKPLPNWVDYIIHNAAEDLIPWINSAIFDFEDFVDLTITDKAPKKETKKKESKKKENKQDTTVAPDIASIQVPIEETEQTSISIPEQIENILTNQTTEITQDEAQLQNLEKQFCESELALQDEKRIAMWLHLAEQYNVLNRSQEAALSWLHVLWLNFNPAVAKKWLESEAKSLKIKKIEEGIEDIITNKTISPQQARFIAAYIIAQYIQGKEIPLNLGDLQTWLNEHLTLLDIRSLWLMQYSLAQLAGGDKLSLYKTKEYILNLLRDGLPLVQNVPNFIRYFGYDTNTSSQALTEDLDNIFARYQKTKRKKALTEAPEELTNAYIYLILAWGHARVGNIEKAYSLQKQAHEALKDNKTDAIHALSINSFDDRIEQSIIGLPVTIPLSANVLTQKDKLDRFLKYKADRLFQVSNILAPQEMHDPFVSFHAETEKRITLTDDKPETITKQIEQVLQEKTVDLALLQETFALLNRLPSTQVVGFIKPFLDKLANILATQKEEKSLLLLQQVLYLADYMERPELIEQIFILFKKATESLPINSVLRVLNRTVAIFMRYQYTAQFDSFIKNLSIPKQGKEHIIGSLQQAALQAALKDTDAVVSTFNNVFNALKEENIQQRLSYLSPMCLALSRSSHQQAQQGIEALFQWLPEVTDSFNTNSHFCLSILQFMDAIIWALADPDLALSDWAKDWIAQDEHHIYQRIQKDIESIQS